MAFSSFDFPTWVLRNRTQSFWADAESLGPMDHSREGLVRMWGSISCTELWGECRRKKAQIHASQQPLWAPTLVFHVLNSLGQKVMFSMDCSSWNRLMWPFGWKHLRATMWFTVFSFSLVTVTCTIPDEATSLAGIQSEEDTENSPPHTPLTCKGQDAEARNNLCSKHGDLRVIYSSA